MSSVQKELETLGDNIVRDAKATVPVRTGNLKASIDSQAEFISNDNFKVVITEKDYGLYVDKGTKYQKAQLYMTNSINKNLPSGIENISNALIDNILKK